MPDTSDRGSRVLIVGCGFPQLGLLRAARELGLYVLGVDANPEAIGAPLCHAFFTISTHDVEAIARAARDASAHGVTTCGSELALTTTVRVAELLGLPFYADVATVERCQAKDLMRDAYRRGGAPIPAFRAVTSRDELDAFLREQRLPIVVKPSRGWGQRGVSKSKRLPRLMVRTRGREPPRAPVWCWPKSSSKARSSASTLTR